jgi:hypothetical protein
MKVPTLELARLHLRTARLCAESQLLFESTTNDEDWDSRLVTLVKNANAIDLGYQNWINTYYSIQPWSYQTLSVCFAQAFPIDGIVHIYHDLWVGNVWIGCYSRRAHLNEVLLHAISLLDSYNLSMQYQIPSKYIIENMVSNICASIPFMLGEVDSTGQPVPEDSRIALGGYLLIWPIHVARWSTEIGSEMEAWMLQKLEDIDQKMGIRLAGNVSKIARLLPPWRLA